MEHGTHMSSEPPSASHPPNRDLRPSRSRLQPGQVVGWVRRAVRAVALLALLLIAVEPISFLILRAAAVHERGRTVAAEAISAYRSEPWSDTYWREHKQVLPRYEAHPYGLWRSRPFSGETIVVDAMGIRRTAHSQCGGDAPTVYVFGGSTVWGQGSPDWETIPSNLAKHFAEAGQPSCVVNMGNDAWRSDEGVIKLIQELKRTGARRPSLVLFMDGCNDVYTPFLQTGQVDLPWNFNKEWLDVLAVRQAGSFRYFSTTNTWTLVQRLTTRLTKSTTLRPLPPDPERVAREIVENYLNNVRIVDGLSRSYGFRYAFFWLPLAIEGEVPTFRVPVEATLPLIRKAAGGHIHDLSSIFDHQAAKLSIDVCHLLPEGHRLLADRIYEIIKRDAGSPR
jgi:lysophospholipase L1-like esterase